MVQLNDKNIGAFLEKGGNEVVLFYADWCRYCQAFLKLLEQNRKGLKHEVNMADLTDEENPLWDRFDVQVVPTLVAFSDGKEVARKQGVPYKGLTKEDLLAIDGALE